MGIMVRERAHQSALMEQRRGDSFCSEQLLPEPQLPSGWEKCLDLKSGLIYFKDWNSGTMTYRDPRRSVPVATQRIGLLSISLAPENATVATKSPSNAAGDSGASKSLKRKPNAPDSATHRFSCSTVRLPWGPTTVDSSATETTNSMEDQSLELTLHLPGTSASRPGTSCQEGSVCTVEKVRSALERSQWWSRPQSSTPLKRRPSPYRESSSPGSRFRLDSSSPTTSQCSSECFTSPSVMSYQGDDEEVQQPRECTDSCAKSQVLFGTQESNVNPVMVAVGCKRCLMYVMLSKSHPSCPQCGNTDVLLELPAPLPKRQRIALESPSWSWTTA